VDQPVKTPPPERIFHVAPKADWQKARQSGTYRPASLAQDGFLHASLAHQVLAVANSVFRGKKGLLLLEIDPSKLRAEVRHEDLRRSGAPYPHIYGPINCNAVVATYPFEPDAKGTFSWPANRQE
jgi:uncharacterized protein (DUF952 family)